MNCWILVLLLCCFTKGTHGSCERDNGLKCDCGCERDRDRVRSIDCGCDMGSDRGKSMDCGCDMGCERERDRGFNRISEREADCDCTCREQRNDSRLEPYIRNF